MQSKRAENVNADPHQTMKIETQMFQNSIFTSKRIDEQNGSLHQHKSTFVVIDYYQGFKPPFLRLILREFKGKNRGRFGWTTLVRSSKWRQRHSPEADFIKIYDKPAYKTKKCCYRHTIYTIKRTHLLEGGVRVRGDAVLRCFWCGFSEIFF